MQIKLLIRHYKAGGAGSKRSSTRCSCKGPAFSSSTYLRCPRSTCISSCKATAHYSPHPLKTHRRQAMSLSSPTQIIALQCLSFPWQIRVTVCECKKSSKTENSPNIRLGWSLSTAVPSSVSLESPLPWISFHFSNAFWPVSSCSPFWISSLPFHQHPSFFLSSHVFSPSSPYLMAPFIYPISAPVQGSSGTSTSLQGASLMRPISLSNCPAIEGSI